jgi:tryptophan 2,3-dioxygenase
VSDSPASLTYGSYLRIDALLEQQRPVSEEHDEMLFIVIHQVYELWFKQLLHEFRRLRTALFECDSPQALATLKRVLTILKTLVAQVDVLETMTPLSFSGFRGRLQASSGFQSAQFRAVEFMLGHKRPELLRIYPEGGPGHALLAAALAEPSIADGLRHYLVRHGVPERREPAPEAFDSALIALYRQRPFEAQVCERLVDLDEGLQEWRYRHVKMVERTIGFKSGSGGSAGVPYLSATLFKPLFPDLWAVRASM